MSVQQTSKEFGEVTEIVSPLSLLLAVDAVLAVSSHNLASHVRAVVCSENDLRTKTENLGQFAFLPGIDISF